MITIDLSGTTTLVTGASGGLGGAIAERFAQAGARVVLHYSRDADGATALARRLDAVTDVWVAQADLTDESAATALLDPAAAYGPVDTLVNNAGVYPTTMLTELTSREWEGVFRLNVTAAFSCLRAAARSMVARGSGSIVNIASLSALRPALHQSAYNSSKAAVVALTRSAAAELGPHGVRVNAVSPGLVDRDGLSTSWPEGVRSWTSRAPLGRLGTAPDVADACVFLASPLAAWITGHDLVVDGGMSATAAY